MPRDIYRLGIAAVNRYCEKTHGKAFADLDAPTRDTVLGALEKGGAQIDDVPPAVFFGQLLQNTREGYFCDPVHGGNHDMAAWKMIGFPGARADFMDFVNQNGKSYPYGPVSINGSAADGRREKPHVDAVIVGFGWTGAILAKELTEAGLNVVALERGEYRDTYPDGAYPNTIDELTYNIRKKLFLDLSKTTVSIRHGLQDTALPYRQLAAFLPGEGVGGAGLHWSGVHSGSRRKSCACAATMKSATARSSSPKG